MAEKLESKLNKVEEIQTLFAKNSSNKEEENAFIVKISEMLKKISNKTKNNQKLGIQKLREMIGLLE